MIWTLAVLPMALLLLGTPIFAIFLIGAVATFVLFLSVPPVALHQIMFGAMENYALLAVPFFIFAGELMSGSGIARRLIVWVLALIGRIPGSLGVATVGACTLIGAISGASTATVAVVGKTLYPGLIREGYGARFASGLLSSSGSIDIVIPPSIAMILFGMAAEQSIAKLFAAGVLPGLLIASMMSAYVVITALRMRLPTRGGFDFARLRAATWDAGPALLMPVFVLAGIYLGWFSPTEAGGFACLYAILVGRFVYREPRLTRDGKPYARPGDAIRKFRHYERRAGRPVFLPIRYADDFVVLVNGTEEQARAEKEALAVFLRNEMKLTLSPEKTHVTSLTEGFEFLGHRVRLRWDDRWGYWPRIEVPTARVKDFRHRIKQHTTRGHTRLSFQEIIDALNPLLLGWGRFYQHCYGAKRVFTRIDYYVWDRLRRWLRKKYPKTPRLVIRRRYWRRLPGRARYRWVDQSVAIVADLKVGRHDLLKMRMPDYAYLARESPVHNERCTPGSGTGAGETGGGNLDSGASPPRSLKSQRARP